MNVRHLAPVALLCAGVVFGESNSTGAPQTVAIGSGALRLKAFLWVPRGSRLFPAVLFNHGSGGADAAPIMLMHAENDYSTTAGRALADELGRRQRTHVLEI